MSNVRKSAATVLAVAVLATSGAFAGTASASPMVRVDKVESVQSDVIKVGGHRHHGWHHRHHHYYGGCYWEKKRFWDPYYGEYFWKPYRFCY